MDLSKGDTRNQRVLVIDDEDHILHLFRDILSGDFDGMPANSGEKGLEAVRSSLEEGNPYALAFIDINMPGLDGLATAQRIREMDNRVYIIIVTGGQDAMIDRIDETLKHDSILFRKPFSVDEVIQLTRNFTKAWKRDRELETRTEELQTEIKRRQDMEARIKYRLKIEAAEARVFQILASERRADLRELLKALVMAMEANRGFIYELREDGSMDNSYEWCAMGTQPRQEELQGLRVDDYPWYLAQMENNDEIEIEDISNLSPDAAKDREGLIPPDCRALLSVPINDRAGDLQAFIGISDTKVFREWTAYDRKALRKCAEMITEFWERMKVEDALRDVQQKYQELLSKQS